MARAIHQIVPDPEVLLSLEPEQVGGVILEHLNSLTDAEREQLNRYNFTLAGAGTFAGYPQAHLERIRRVIMEGWMWLEREGLIAPKPGEQGDWVFITRRGQQMKGRTDFAAYQKSNLLPRGLLHPVLASKVASLFTGGDYDTAVFQAFKEVEVAVRTKGRFTDADVGVQLMRKAFDPKTGPLRDINVVEAEREATAHLFAGAIGLFKNPQSHRNVAIGDPTEAVELLLLASHLLRSSTRDQPWSSETRRKAEPDVIFFAILGFLLIGTCTPMCEHGFVGLGQIAVPRDEASATPRSL